MKLPVTWKTDKIWREMADINYENAVKYCKRYSDDLNRIYPNTRLYYILHYRGQKNEQIAKLLPDIRNHPAHDEAQSLLKFRSPGHDNSAFLGMVIGFRKTLFGLKQTPECLAFISINLNQHETEEDLYYAIHSHTAIFLEMVDFYTQKHSALQTRQILQPKRNNIATARMNLKADVYSVIQMVHNGYLDATGTLAKKRALNAITAQSNHPEEFPFPIALEVTEFGLEKFLQAEKKSPINTAYKLAKQVSASFDGENLQTWINFVNPAQTMAWNGYQPSQILGCAIQTSSNPFIKSTGHLLAEILGIEPVSIPDRLSGAINPFAQNEVNFIEHERSIEETFEMVLIHAMEADSHLPLIHVANNQNEGLIKGRISGWCAHALQSAANAYTTASQRGMPRDQAARIEFESAKQQTGWKELNQLGDHITKLHRNGQAVTMSSITEWCADNPQFKTISQSIKMTVADPNFGKKLEATVAMPMPSPATPAPQPHASLDLGPTVAPTVAPMATPAPSLGGGMMGGGMIGHQHHSRQATQTTTEEQQ